jgi:hypothetical protein
LDKGSLKKEDPTANQKRLTVTVVKLEQPALELYRLVNDVITRYFPEHSIAEYDPWRITINIDPPSRVPGERYRVCSFNLRVMIDVFVLHIRGRMNDQFHGGVWEVHQVEYRLKGDKWQQMPIADVREFSD